MDRTNIYFSKPQKAALEKIAKPKGRAIRYAVGRRSPRANQSLQEAPEATPLVAASYEPQEKV